MTIFMLTTPFERAWHVSRRPLVSSEILGHRLPDPPFTILTKIYIWWGYAVFEHIETWGSCRSSSFEDLVSLWGFSSDFKLLETTGLRVGWVRRTYFLLLLISSPFLSGSFVNCHETMISYLLKRRKLC